MRKVILPAALCLLACLCAAAQDRSTPESTVRAFLSAFSSGDVKQAATCVKGVRMDYAAQNTLAQQIHKDPASFELSDAKTTITGTSATITGQIVLKSAKSEKTETYATQINLILEGGAWKILPDAARAKQDKPDVTNALAYMLTDTKVFTEARDAARSTACLSNMKQICLAALIFIQDADERFSLKAASYKKSLMPYTKNEAIFKCPSDVGGGSSYSFNSNLAGIRQAKIKAPAETVMIYEGKNGQLDFRHDGRAAVSFADGHAKLLNAAAAKKLRWKP